MGLPNRVVDVYLASVNQTPGEHSGVLGRITDLQNGVVTHYDPGNGMPRRMKVQQRNGFATLTTDGHNSNTGETETIAWANPELLSTLGNQLLSIANAIPRVYDGTDWTHYGAERVVSNVLSESVFHTSQRTIDVPDQAWSNGVTCSVWAERPNPETTTTILYVGFRGDDGAWIRTPQILYDPLSAGDHVITFAKCIADTDGEHFWAVFNGLQSSDDVFFAALFDLNGVELDRVPVEKVQDVFSKWAFWDIIPIVEGGCLLAQPENTVVSSTDGVKYTSFTVAGSSISSATTDDPNIHTQGPLAWMTNDLGDGFYYLATIGQGEEPSGKLWGYQVSTDDLTAFTHEFDFNAAPAVDTTVDSLIGFASSGDNEDEPTLTVSFTSLLDEAASVGPARDPQFRYSEVWECTWANATTFIRQNDYTCQISRAFKHDDEYYGINYYQSGSGNAIESTQVTVDWTDGDYIIGQKLQPVVVTAGLDNTRGSAKTLIEGGGGNIITTTNAQASFSILPGDTVEQITIDQRTLIFGIRTMQVLKWTLTNVNPFLSGSRLVVSGSTGVTGANGTFNIIGQDFGSVVGGYVYTETTSILGGTVDAGTFVTGSAEATKMTFYRMFTGDELGNYYDEATKDFLVNGTMDVTGNASGVNNGTKTIDRPILSPSDDLTGNFGVGIWIVTGTEVSSSSGFTAVLHPGFENDWILTRNFFDDALLVGPHTLIVGDDPFQLPGPQLPPAGSTGGPVDANNASSGAGYTITDTTAPNIIETDGAAITAQIFKDPPGVPEITVQVPDDLNGGGQYLTLFLQSITADSTYIGATLVVTGDTSIPDNNGVYTIIDFNPDTSTHLFYVVPADGNLKQKTQFWYSDEQTISIIFRTNVQPEFQPCWLMVPLTGSKPVVGRFEYGIAFADWRYEGDTTFGANLFPGAVGSPWRSQDAWLFMLPYRAVSFTVGQSLATASGQVINAAISTNASTIGLKQFTLSDTTGIATTSSTQLMLPGPMCGEFTASGFNENGVNFGFEAPFFVSQQVSDAGTGAGLRTAGSYQYVVVAEVTDEDGDRIFSIVSPPLNTTLSGDNNSIKIGGRMLQPLDEFGVPVEQHFGVTNRRLLGISIYRTSYQAAVPTTEHHKITLDLSVNGLAPVSNTNASGFTFLDDFTWNYLDENLDAAILSNEILYTDKGFLPRFPAPAQRQGTFWKNRSWVIGYDGAVWMSGEKTEGDAIWFFPLFRYVLPTTDKPVALAEMDDYLIVFCSRSIWYIPSGNFPNATGREGTLPTPVQTPFTNGCTGHAVTLREGVAYSSTAGGVWLVTRSLENKWLSQPVQDTLGDTPIRAMAIDEKQRLFVTNQTSYMMVYDQVVQVWYRWNFPTSEARYLATLAGDPVFQDPANVWKQTPLAFFDDLAGTPVGVPPDVTLSSFNFSNVRGLKAVWEMQLVGTYKGEHHINAVISYPDDAPDEPTIFPDPVLFPDGFTPDPDSPYLLAINPMIEQASSYGLRVFADFEGIEEPGNSFELEIIACEVGVDSTVGLNKFVSSRRIEGS